MTNRRFSRLVAALATISAVALPGTARAENFEAEFDKLFGKQLRAPREVVSPVRPFVAPTRAAPTVYGGSLEATVASLANATQGRIGVAAMDLGTGRTVGFGSGRFQLLDSRRTPTQRTLGRLGHMGRIYSRY